MAAPDEPLRIDLPHPMPAADDCLPHAAMHLGTGRAVGMRARPAMVSRVIVQKVLGGWQVMRLDEGGGFVGDTHHADRADALRTVSREFGVTVESTS